MNRRDLLKGLAAAGVVLPALGNAEQAKEARGVAGEHWHTHVIGDTLTINVDNVLNFTREMDRHTQHPFGHLDIPQQFIIDNVFVELYFDNVGHAEFLHSLHGKGDVVCISKKMAFKLTCSSVSGSTTINGADGDVILNLHLQVDKEERI